MTDQDEFAPLQGYWKTVYNLFIKPASPEQVAQHARSVLKAMLYQCGGCPALPDLILALNQFRLDVVQRELPGWDSKNPAEVAFTSYLDKRALFIDNRRIDAVAVRTSRIEGVDIALKTWVPRGDSFEVAFATRVLENVLRHCCLDRARALAVGAVFDEMQARMQYDEIFALLAPSLEKLGSKLAADPSGRFRSSDPRFVAKQETAAILQNSDYDMGL